MSEVEASIGALEKLVNELPAVSFDATVPKRRSTKKRVRKLAGPHIREHCVKGKRYYYYIRGTDKEIYLGDAESILKAMKGG